MHRQAARSGLEQKPSRLGAWAMLAAALVASLILGGCQEMGVDAAPRMAPGVPIAVETIDGPPAAIQTALTQAFAGAAAQHKITLVDDAQSPSFRLKGYLTATPTADGRTSLDYVWDLFDANDQRAQRVTGSDIVAGDATDPWAPVDDKALRKLADRSMDGIADFLAGAGPASGPNVATATPGAPLTRQEVVAGAAVGGQTDSALGYARRQ